MDRNSLLATIDRLRIKIDDLRRSHPAVNEQNTKNTLINPLLQALGWDIADLAEIQCEYRHLPGDDPVDYAFFLAKSPCLFVEAKALAVNVNAPQWIGQTVAYAARAGVDWSVLSNGDEYRIYYSRALGAAPNKIFRAVKLSDHANTDFTVDTISLLAKDSMAKGDIDTAWKTHSVDGKVKSHLEQLVQGPDDALVALLVKHIGTLSKPDIKAALGRAKVDITFPRTPPAGPRVQLPKLPMNNQLPARPTIKDLITSGKIVAPLDIEAVYKKTPLKAKICSNGSIEFMGKNYDSLSTAAGMARNSVSGPPPNGRPFWPTNGWDFWSYRDVAGQLKKLGELRPLPAAAP